MNEKLVIGIGGRYKGVDQIKCFPKPFVVADDSEAGLDSKMPLWLFGFLHG